jgi:hypothetical protein
MKKLLLTVAVTFAVAAVRWLFYFPPQYGHSGVVVNVAPVESASAMATAYWTAVDAISCYEKWGEVPPEQAQPNIGFR